MKAKSIEKITLQGGRLGLLADLWILSKPRITGMVLLATLGGYIMASGDIVDWIHLSQVLVATLFLGAGVNSLNQYIERETDKLMTRTRNRPLPAGRMQPKTVLLLGGGASIFGAGLLAIVANPLTGLIGSMVIILYLFCYTPMKRRSGINTLIGAIPGALPPVLGWAAVTGRVEPAAIIMFLIIFTWQPPHFLSIAYLYRDQYLKAGMPMLTVVDLGGATRRQLILYSITLIPISMYPSVMGLTGEIYYWGALILGLCFLAAATGMVIWTSRSWALILLKVSVIYLPLLFALMLYDAQGTNPAFY